MAIKSSRDGSALIMQLQGKFGIGPNLDEFRTGWQDALEDGAIDIVLDLGGVSMVDSSAIGSMIRCNSALTARGGRIRIVAANDTVRQAFRVTRLDSIFQFFDDQKSALAARAAKA